MKSSKVEAPTSNATEETLNSIVHVNSSRKLTSLLESIDGLPTKPPLLFLDAEGFHDDTVAFLQLFAAPKNAIYKIALCWPAW